MSALQLSSGQSQIIADIDQFLQSAFGYGVENNSLSQIVAPITNYLTLTSSQQDMVKDIFKSLISAYVYTSNIPAEQPVTTFSGTVALARLTGLGSDGSLTVVNGLITAYVAPT
jgi:hypothetical protein